MLFYQSVKYSIYIVVHCVVCNVHCCFAVFSMSFTIIQMDCLDVYYASCQFMSHKYMNTMFPLIKFPCSIHRQFLFFVLFDLLVIKTKMIMNDMIVLTVVVVWMDKMVDKMMDKMMVKMVVKMITARVCECLSLSVLSTRN